MNDYETKQEQQRQRYLELAEQADADARAMYEGAHQAVAGIPPGQPILVGHHSEKRHRRDLGRHDTRMRKAFELEGKAAHYRSKAAGIGTGGISADDPDAAAKLQAKIDQCEHNQATMKAANKVIRGKQTDTNKVATLVQLGIPDGAAAKLLEPDFCGRVGFPQYMLANNNANIKRMRERVERLLVAPKRSQAFDYPDSGCKILVNADMNRTQVLFPGKPPEPVRQALKSHGFRWSPTQGAWQRQISQQAFYWADQICRQYGAA